MKTIKIVKIDKKEGSLGLSFSYIIYLSNDGIFSATLPQKISTLFRDHGIILNQNRLGNYGYFASNKMNDLIKQVKNTIDLFFSRKLVKKETVIQFQIRTTCSYCKSRGKNGDIVPNGYWIEDKYKKGGCDWFGGNITQDAAHRYPYGILVYARPFHKKTFEYIDSSKVFEYENISGNENFDNEYYLKFLNDFCAMDPMRDVEMQEIPYTEESAKFFVNLLVSICSLNDKIKEYLNSDGIQFLIDSKIKLLSG